MYRPKISIVTITFNSEKTVRDTFESVREQGYDNLEYIIVDGGSKDATLKIAEEYRDIITLIVSEVDEGISDAMNKGIRRATGELIGIIHSDDQLAEGALEKLAKVWDDTSDVYYGHSIVCNEDGDVSHVLCAKEDLSELQYGLCLVHPSTFITKSAYEKYGFYDKEYKCSMDYELLLRFYKSGAHFKFMDEKLAVYRVGGTNMKYRKRTINEVREIAVRYGGNPIKADIIRIKKIVIDRVRPVLNYFKLSGSRVKKL